MMLYPYQIISTNPKVPAAPILQVSLFHPAKDHDRCYQLDAFLDTGADTTLIPLEAVSILRLPLLDERIPVMGVGGAITNGFLCRSRILIGECWFPSIRLVACESIVVGGSDQMIIGRDILNRRC